MSWADILTGKVGPTPVMKGKARTHFAELDEPVKNDPEYRRAERKAYYERHKERERENARQWQADHRNDPERKAKRAEYRKKWSKTPHRMAQARIYAARQYAKKRNDPAWVEAQRERSRAYRARKRSEARLQDQVTAPLESVTP